MKKFINDVDNCVFETIEGLVSMHGDKYFMLEDLPVLVRKNIKKDKVGIVTGGGSGHEPGLLEYAGYGLADAACQGNIFAAPSPNLIYKGAKAVETGNGVIFIYTNYAGDVLNFDMAAEILSSEGINNKTVRVADDVSAAPIERKHDRRGIAGAYFTIKIAGAASEKGLNIEEIVRLAEKAEYNTRSMNVASSAGSIPGKEEKTFNLPDGFIEIGMGMHGEVGVRRSKMLKANQIVDEMLDIIIKDLPFIKNDQVGVLVNGLGATSRMELYIITNYLKKRLLKEGFRIHDILMGNFTTCQEMQGFGISLFKIDDELIKYYDYPAWAPFYNNLTAEK